MLWKLRAIVYGAAAAVIALVLIGLGGEDEPAFVDGRTSQGRGITVQLEDGRPTTVGMGLEGDCGDGSRAFVRWWSFDGRNPRFRFSDGQLEVRETVSRTYAYGWRGEREFSLVARLSDDRVRGTVSYTEHVRRAGESYDCVSGDVSFSAG